MGRWVVPFYPNNNTAHAQQALLIAHKSGLDLQLAHDAIRSAAGGSWMFNDRGPRIIEAIEGSAADQVEVKSAVQIFVKDLEIVREQARACDVESRLASAALALFQYGKEKLLLGSADDSLVVKVRVHHFLPAAQPAAGLQAAFHRHPHHQVKLPVS